MIIALGDTRNRKVLSCPHCNTIFTFELSDLDCNKQLECPQCGHKCTDVSEKVIYSKSYKLTDNEAIINDYTFLKEH